MNEIDSKNVEKNVESAKGIKAANKAPSKKSKYKKGKFPNTLQDRKTKALYVRRSVTVNRFITDPQTGKEKFIKQRQIWRVVEPQTQERVDQILQEIEAEISLAKSGKPKPLTNFAEIAEKFELTELTEAVFQNERKISGKIQLRMPKTFLKTITDHFGSFDISEITFGDLQEFKTKRLNTPIKYKSGKTKQRSVRTVNYELSVLKQVLNFAVRNRWLDRNPFADGKNLIDASQVNKRNKTWTKAEEQVALELCTGIYKHMKAVIICVVDGGFRKNELLSAKWSEVDFENDFMLAKNYKGNSLSVRPVFFTKRMREALLEWKPIQQKRKKTDKTLVIGYADVKKAWNYIREKIERSDLNLHDLRHVFATRLSSRNVDLAAISKLLGHQNLKTTQIYINPETAGLRDAIKTLED